MKFSLIIDGNTKLGREVKCFNVPPVKTCRPTKWCMSGLNGRPACYAQRGRFQFSAVARSMERRYQASLKSDFVKRMTDELKRKKRVKYFRIHASGDFYSAAYVRKWIAIAKRFPKIVFWAATRRRDLAKVLKELNALPNVIIRESLDPCVYTPQLGFKIAAISGIPGSEKMFKCPGGCPKCGYHCWTNRDSVRFDIH